MFLDSVFVAVPDIVAVAIGQAHFLKADMVRPGAVVVDVGMNRLPDGKLTGDVDFAEVEKVASALNGLGVTPRDMMAIFQAMKQAGALQAELLLR